jgi:hypothetical protein
MCQSAFVSYFLAERLKPASRQAGVKGERYYLGRVEVALGDRLAEIEVKGDHRTKIYKIG